MKIREETCGETCGDVLRDVCTVRDLGEDWAGESWRERVPWDHGRHWISSLCSHNITNIQNKLPPHNADASALLEF